MCACGFLEGASAVSIACIVLASKPWLLFFFFKRLLRWVNTKGIKNRVIIAEIRILLEIEMHTFQDSLSKEFAV